MATFPTAYTDRAPTRTSKVFGDTGTDPANFVVSALFGLIVLNDIFEQLMLANSVVEEVPATTTAYTFTAADKNKTKRFLCSGACAVSIPGGMPKGYVVDWIQGGAGTLTFAGATGGGQTVQSLDGTMSAGLHGRGTLECVAANTWNNSGALKVS